MATAVSKPASHPPKMKRPPPPFAQNGVKGVKPSQPSSSPSTASKRLPGANQSASANSAGNSVANNGNNRAVNRPKKEMQKQGEPPSRLQRPATRTATAEVDRRMAKKFPEPYGGLTRCGAMDRLGIVRVILIYHSSSQNNLLHPQEILKMPSLAHSPSPSDTFPLRSTRWKFSV